MKKVTQALAALLLLSAMLSGCAKPASTPEDSQAITEAPVSSEEPTTPALPAANPASDFSYEETEDGGIRIKWYLGTAQNVVIPDTINQKPVTCIGRNAFQPNIAVSVTMPDTVTVIENNCFQNCDNLETITLSNSLLEIGHEAFEGCDSLRQIQIPASVRSIGWEAFYNAWIETLEFEEGSRLETIERLAFAGTALKQLILPDRVRTIRSSAFSNCHFLKEVKLNEGLVSIEAGAFYEADRLKEIVIPKTVENVNEMVFERCFELKSIYFEGNAPSTYEYVNEISGLQKPAFTLSYIIYYHESATGFTSPLWYDYQTKTW